MTNSPTDRKAKEMSRFDQWVMCNRKKQFTNLKNAERRAREMDCRVYECPLCGGYHLTKRKRKGAAA